MLSINGTNTGMPITKSQSSDKLSKSERDVASESAERFRRRQDVIRTSWNAVQFGLNIKASQVFYEKFFDELPEARSLFKDDMTEQYNKLFKAISLVVKVIEDMDQVGDVLKDLGRRHASMGIGRAHFEFFAECFIDTLNSFIMREMPNNYAMDWMFDVNDAWEWALAYIIDIMAEAAEEHEEEKLRKRLAAKK